MNSDLKQEGGGINPNPIDSIRQPGSNLELKRRV